MEQDPTSLNQQPTTEHSAFVRWKHSWFGRLVWTVLDIAIVLSFATLAIDSGALWQWGVALLFTIDAVYNFVQLIRTLIHHGKQANRTR